MKRAILVAGGSMNLVLAVFHMFFWKMMNWGEELPRLSVDNRGVMQIANIIMIFLLVYFSIASFMMAKYGTIERYGKSILLCIAGFYAIRLITGYPFFGFSLGELAVWIICGLLLGGYLTVFFMERG